MSTPGQGTEEQEPGCPLQDLLPAELRETLAQTLPLADRLAWRRCSRPLRDAFDASNTAVSVCDEVGGEALVGLVRRMPRLASLEVADLWPGVDWHGVLSGLQALRVGWPMRGSRAAGTPPAQGVLRTIGEACGATLRRLELQPLFDLEDASWLAPCTALTRLALKMCPMPDLDALASCATLQEVEVTMCYNLEDIGGLASSGATLEHLDVRMTGVSDLAPLASCRGAATPGRRVHQSGRPGAAGVVHRATQAGHVVHQSYGPGAAGVLHGAAAPGHEQH